MKVQYRIPKTPLAREQNFVIEVKSLWHLYKLFRAAKKVKATCFYIFF